MDLALTPEQEQLVGTVRDFCAREFAPDIAKHDAEAYHDPDTFAKLAEIGLPGICFPERYGGSGMDYLSLGLVCEELDYVDEGLQIHRVAAERLRHEHPVDAGRP